MADLSPIRKLSAEARALSSEVNDAAISLAAALPDDDPGALEGALANAALEGALRLHGANAMLDRLANLLDRLTDVTEDEIEREACSHCGTPTPIEERTHFGEDADFCPACSKEWQETFDRCQHDWATVDPEGGACVDEYGEPARFCHKCNGMMILEAPR